MDIKAKGYDMNVGGIDARRAVAGGTLVLLGLAGSTLGMTMIAGSANAAAPSTVIATTSDNPTESPSESPSESASETPSETPSESPSESTTPSVKPSESTAAPSESTTPTVKPSESTAPVPSAVAAGLMSGDDAGSRSGLLVLLGSALALAGGAIGLSSLRSRGKYQA